MTMEDPELAEIRAKKLRELVTSVSANGPTGWTGPVTLTDATFDGETHKPGCLLVDFWAEWCGPCHRVAPVLDEVAKAHADRLRLGKLNIDENPRTPAHYGIMSIPTILLFKDGKLVDGIIGAVPRGQIEAVLSRWM